MSTLEHLYFVKLLMLVPIMILEWLFILGVFIGLIYTIIDIREVNKNDEMD